MQFLAADIEFWIDILQAILVVLLTALGVFIKIPRKNQENSRFKKRIQKLEKKNNAKPNKKKFKFKISISLQ